MEYSQEEKETAIKSLKSFGIKKNSEIYSYVRSVSQTGMSRQIKFFIPVETTEGVKITDITYAVAKITSHRFNKDNYTLSVSGCGMDMCFSVVYALAGEIFRDAPAFEKEMDKGYWLKSVNLN